MSVSHQVQKPLCLLMALVCYHAVASSYQAQPCIAYASMPPFEAGRRAAVSKPIPDTFSEAHFCRCSHMLHVVMTLQGINRFYGGVRTCTRNAGSASGSASLLRVHGHPDKLHCLTYPDVVA